MTAHALKLEAIEPIGTQRTHAFINRGHADDGTALNHSFEEIVLAWSAFGGWAAWLAINAAGAAYFMGRPWPR